jgi:hypothetical protein
MIRRIALFNTGAEPPAHWDAAAELWAANSVGAWSNGIVHVNLSSKIDAAAQYRLRFVAQRGRVTAVHDAVLLLDGIPHRELIHSIGNAPDRIMLDITSVGPDVAFEGRIEGAEAGTILLQKL